MRIDGRDDYSRYLEGLGRLDLAEVYLANLDSSAGLFAGMPLGDSDIRALGRPPRSLLGAPQVHLPTPERATTLPLGEALRRRRSVRRFKPEALTLRELSEVLLLALGEIDEGPEPIRRRRTYPSGGALYPVEPYVLARRVEGLHEGVYQYDARSHRLATLRCEPVEFGRYFFEPLEFSGPDGMLATTAFALVLASHLRRSYYKYGDRAWKLALLEAGHMAQNVSLACAALEGLGACALGGFAGAPLTRFLDLGGSGQMVLYALVVGRTCEPAGQE